jgi:hypothetical protein
MMAQSEIWQLEAAQRLWPPRCVPIFAAPSADAAMIALADFERGPWAEQFPTVV